MSLVATLCVAGAALLQRVGPVLLGLTLLGALLAGALLGWQWLRRFKQQAAAAVLAADMSGCWRLGEAGQWRQVVPAQVWRGPFWITLSLVPFGESGENAPAVVTVWRGAVPAQSWRKLCILLRARAVRVGRSDIAEVA